jgi:cytochrome P450
MIESPLLNAKPWPEMTRKEKLAAYDEITKAFDELADEFRQEIDMHLAASQCTMRTTVKILLDVDPNDDPRLPGK